MRRLLTIFMLTSGLVANAYSADIDIVGTINTPKPNKSSIHNFAAPQQHNSESVPLLKLELSSGAQQTFANRVTKVAEDSPQYSAENSKHKQLGMNNVPVLNQGRHGACVMFSVSAALDAAMEQGDYISQICQLSLGRYLEENGYTTSGWNGSWSRNVLGQIELFGFISKDNQHNVGCAGLTEYPLYGDDLTNSESPDNFHKLSERLGSYNLAWSPIIDVYQAAYDHVNTNNVLQAVKNTLEQNERVVFGVLLLDFDQGIAGAQAKFKNKNDTWVLTPEMLEHIKDQTEYAGHAMVITGYDDDAVAFDQQGRPYKGLLTLRNSWGSKIGDHGDFYMSYNYFKGLVLEAQRIRKLQVSEQE